MRIFCKILRERYGIQFTDANAIISMWVIDIIHGLRGVDYAKNIIREVNNKRNSLGMFPIYVRYGHPLF